MKKHIFVSRSLLATFVGMSSWSTSSAIAQSSMPSLYVDSRSERVISGENVLRHGYLALLENCEASGLPTSALSEQEVQLVGVTRVQRWFEPDAFAFREESWSFNIAGQQRDQMCQFSLGYEGRHAYADQDEYVIEDLQTGERESREFIDRDIFERSAMTGDSGGERHEIGGQNCISYTHVAHEVCIWDGGTAWGFRVSPALFETNTLRQMNTRLILRQEPLGSAGVRVTTETFTIGAHNDRDTMRP